MHQLSQPTAAPTRRTTSLRLLVSLALIATTVAFLPASATAQSSGRTCGGKLVTIEGTNDADVIYGTDGADVIWTGNGNDTIYAGAGPDYICSGNGNDYIEGNAGHDRIWAGGGHDKVRAGGGNDRVWGGAGKDRIFGQHGIDRLRGDTGVDRVHGGNGDDILRGGDQLDTLWGAAGEDTCVSPGDTILECELPLVAGPSTSAYADEMLRLINVERTNRSLAPVGRNADLDAYAQAWAVEMSKIPLPLSASKHHSPPFTGSNHPFQPLPSSTSWTAAFENVGYSTVGGSESPEDVINRLFYTPNGFGFMSSPGHKCNIVETGVSEVGVGAYVDSAGAVWVVQVFWGTASPLPAPIAECASVVNR